MFLPLNLFAININYMLLRYNLKVFDISYYLLRYSSEFISPALKACLPRKVTIPYISERNIPRIRTFPGVNTPITSKTLLHRASFRCASDIHSACELVIKTTISD